MVQLGIVNPKSPENMGAILRSAGCFQADAIFYTGKRYSRAAKFSTDTKSVAGFLKVSPVENLLEVVPENSTVICIELAEGAAPLAEFQHPRNAFYIFGPEDGSIPQALIDEADAVLYIPTIGCLNLAATVNIVLYDRMAKSGAHPGGDALIRTSRDTNNRLKVKI